MNPVQTSAEEQDEPREDSASEADAELPALVVLCRLAAVMVFLIAFLVALFGWDQIGGTAHFDMTPAYWKAPLCVAFAFAVTRAAMAAASASRTWNAASARWYWMVLAVVLAMGAVTFYYHLQEPVDEESVEDRTSA